MRPRVALASVLAVMTVAAVGPAGATNVGGGAEVIVAMIDTGIRPTHQEFDYQGPSSATDQVVAWWDFTDDKGSFSLPTLGQTWDTRTPDPYDGFGHGTATAAMAVGLNADDSKSRSYAPGAKLAVARVGNNRGEVVGNIAAAVRWATDTVRADVINISIGSIVPFPATLDFNSTYAAIAYARDRGVLTVVANGNGFGNVGVTGDPSWASNYGSSLDVLSVGANGANALLASTDPEVTAIFAPFTASKNGDTTYAQAVGTSLSSPTVAGMAATAMQTALANGHAATPDYIEKLLKHSASDNPLFPPNYDGYGELNATQFDEIVMPHAAAGTLPGRPDPDLAAMYVESVVAPLRDTWSNRLNRSYNALDHDPGTPEGVIGASTPVVLEGETYTITLAPGESATITMTYDESDDVEDVDLFAFSAGHALSAASREGRSVNGAAQTEEITLSAPLGATYTILAAGWSVARFAYITVASTSTNPATPEVGYGGQDTYVATDGLGVFL